MTDEATMDVAADQSAVIETPEISDEQIEQVPERNEPISTRDALAKAFKDTEQSATKETPETGKERNPDGTFKAKEVAVTPDATDQAKTEEKPTETSKFADPPSRFSPDAKAAWATAPDPVKAEITRAVSELEGGIEQYKQAYEPFREFAENLKSNGQDFQNVIAHYTGIEQKLANDPIGGLDQICQNMGLTLRQVAEHVSGQTPDQHAGKQEATINELRNELATIKQELGGVSTTIKSQTEAQTLKEIETFAADKPRFDELSNDVAFFLSNGRAQDLQEAYNLAERLNPTPQVETPAPVAQATQTTETAQTRKGKLSTTGAPSSGSNPANRKPPSSARDAVAARMAEAGF